MDIEHMNTSERNMDVISEYSKDDISECSMDDSFECTDIYEYYVENIYWATSDKWERIEMEEIFIKELIDGNYDFDKSDIFKFIKSSLLELFNWSSYDTLIMILESEYWQVFELNEMQDGDHILARRYCIKHYLEGCYRNEFMKLLCEKIDFSKSLRLIEKYLNVDMYPKKRTYTEMVYGYKMLDYSNVDLEDEEVVDWYFYDFIENKYYLPLIVNNSNKKKC